jgi:competence ComEA-like helix-hairpin-helix protein
VKWLDGISILSLALSGALLTIAGIGLANANGGQSPSSAAVVDDSGRAVPLDTLMSAGEVGLIDVQALSAAEEPAAEAPPAPTVEPPAPSSPPVPRSAAASPGSRCVNINTAGESELVRLRGVGPAIAARIIEHRTTNGPFRRKEDIKNVRGIGPATFERLANDICL